MDKDSKTRSHSWSGVPPCDQLFASISVSYCCVTTTHQYFRTGGIYHGRHVCGPSRVPLIYTGLGEVAEPHTADPWVRWTHMPAPRARAKRPPGTCGSCPHGNSRGRMLSGNVRGILWLRTVTLSLLRNAISPSKTHGRVPAKRQGNRYCP